jgi:hypothetical protein
MNLENKIKELKHLFSKYIRVISLAVPLSFTFACGADEESFSPSCRTDYDCPDYAACVLGSCEVYEPVPHNDLDGDGYDGINFGGLDCNDNDKQINPGVVDFCDDGTDNNCNGEIDENCSQRIIYLEHIKDEENPSDSINNIVIMKNNGIIIGRMKDVGHPIMHLSCSPDGKWLAYNEELDSIWWGKLKADGTEYSLTNWEYLRDRTKGYTYPNWSPNGDKLVFGYRSNGFNIATIEKDGSNIYNITNPENLARPEYRCFYPTWSPLGNIVVFVCSREGNNNSPIDNGPFYQIDLFTLEISMFSDVRDARYPDFCPDGSLIYDKTFGGIYRLKNGEETRVYAVGEHPKCSPDGTKVVFDNEGKIYTIDLNGSNLTELPTGDVYVSFPDWCL